MLRNAQVRVADHRVVRREALRLLDVARPLGMLFDRVDGEPDDFHLAPVELRLELAM